MSQGVGHRKFVPPFKSGATDLRKWVVIGVHILSRLFSRGVEGGGMSQDVGHRKFVPPLRNGATDLREWVVNGIRIVSGVRGLVVDLTTDGVSLRNSAIIRDAGNGSIFRSTVTRGIVFFIEVWLLGSVGVHSGTGLVRVHSGGVSLSVCSDRGSVGVHSDRGCVGAHSDKVFWCFGILVFWCVDFLKCSPVVLVE